MNHLNEQLDKHFDWVRHASIALPPREHWRYASLGDMLRSDDPGEDSRPILIGADRNGPIDISLAELRCVAARASRWCQSHGLEPGDSLLLVRLPYSSEVPLAAAVITLMSLGFRVVLPMSFDRDSLVDIGATTNCRAMLWCADLAESSSQTQVLQADAMFRAVVQELEMVTCSLDGPQSWHRVDNTAEEAPSDELQFCHVEREVLVLSTSGSTGQPKLARYTNHALLRVAESWKAAGLMSEAVTGGRSICPTLSHSMGLRNVLHAIWNRQPTLLAQPEWMDEQPKRFVKLLERCLPQHITCGPALLNDLGLLAVNLQRFRNALSTLRYVVSSGAAEVASKYPIGEDVQLANAFGMTETQQVLNTLVGPGSDVAGALGRPLPGVSVAVRYEDVSQQIGRLFVSVPFGASGYVNAPNFGKWFDTGDVVRVAGEELVWMGRANEDFLSTGQGVKVSLAELRSNYVQLQREVEAILFMEAPSVDGVAALVYVGQSDPVDTEVHRHLLQAIDDDHQQMASQQRDFALHYTALSVVGCIAGQPPKRGPGKIDRERALAEQTELLTAMNDIATDHSQIILVPQHGSDRPNWRRFATGNS